MLANTVLLFKDALIGGSVKVRREVKLRKCKNKRAVFHLSQSLHCSWRRKETIRSGGSHTSTDPKNPKLKPGFAHRCIMLVSFFFAKQHKECRKLHLKVILNEQLKCLHHAYDVRWDSFIDHIMLEVTLVIIWQTLFLILTLWLSLVEVIPGSQPLCTRWFSSNYPYLGTQHTHAYCDLSCLWLIFALFMLICSPLSRDNMI